MLNLSLAISVATPRLDLCVTARKYASPATVRTSVGERFSLDPRRSLIYSSDATLNSLQVRQQFDQHLESLFPEA